MPRTEDRLPGRMAGTARLAHTALSRATEALLDPESALDRAMAVGRLVAAERALHELGEAIEDEAAAVLPYRSAAADARTIVVGLHTGHDLERLAELARQVVDIAGARQPRPLPARLRLPLRGISGIALTMVAKAADLLESGEVAAAADLQGDLYEIGQRRRLLYQELLSTDHPVGAPDTVDATLLSCHYESCADHAVSMTRYAALFAEPAPTG